MVDTFQTSQFKYTDAPNIIIFRKFVPFICAYGELIPYHISSLVLDTVTKIVLSVFLSEYVVEVTRFNRYSLKYRNIILCVRRACNTGFTETVRPGFQNISNRFLDR